MSRRFVMQSNKNFSLLKTLSTKKKNSKSQYLIALEFGIYPETLGLAFIVIRFEL